jgi:MYXO-CTERM domain-containing protein
MRAALSFALLLAACSTDAVVGENISHAANAGTGPAALDILFVVDNSGSMAEEQTALVASFPRFLNVLSSLPMGPPDLHIAVISSNVGISPFQTTGCVGNGDDGRFQNAPRTACTPPSGYFISDVGDPLTGDRITNYPATTTLPDVFSCIAKLGTTGCGLEQHFESMKRALDGHRPENVTFLRDDATLVIIFVADEDDCSASDGDVFDPEQTDISDPLGVFSSFRCSEYGITCEEGNLARAPGMYTGCVPRSDSPYIHHPDHYVEFLRSLKADPDKLVVAAIVGTPTPVEVRLDFQGDPELAPSCGFGSASFAEPGVRFQYLLSQFPDRSMLVPICNEDLSDAFTLIGSVVESAVLDRPTPVEPDAGSDDIYIDAGPCSVSAAAPGAGGALLFALALLPALRRRRGRN